MSRIRQSHVFLSAAFAALMPGALHAQSCMWTYHEAPPISQSSSQVVYHEGLQRILFIEHGGNSLASIRIWSWDGAAWTLVDDSGPQRRYGAAAAYDSVRNRIVLFGGEGWQNTSPVGTTYPTDTWEWTGESWVQSAVVGPPARRDHRMAYDSARQRTVLFGGFRQGYLGDTWEWDGTAWVQAASTGPSPRAPRAFAYDSARGRTMLFSGTSYSGPHDDLWEWDGSTWTMRTGNHPGSEGIWMVFDPARERMIVGRAEPIGPWSHRHETWELDGSTAQWMLRDPGTAPWGAAAFDVARGRLVVVSSNQTTEFHSAGTDLSPYVVEQPLCDPCTVGAPAIITVDAAGASPLSYQWHRNGQPLVDGGNISGATTSTLTIDPYRPVDSGAYEVVISNHCATVISDPVEIGGLCYPNCDRSYVEPMLNVDDFTCFIWEFAAGSNLPHEEQLTHYANCDGSAVAPVLNVDDFTCFVNAWAAGCP